MVGGGAGAAAGVQEGQQQEWQTAENGVTEHWWNAETGEYEFRTKWRPSRRAVTEEEEEWEVEKVVPCDDAPGFELVYWCDTWEPVSSFVDEEGFHTEAYMKYRRAHPDL